AECRMNELMADAHERPSPVEPGVAEDVEQGRALLDELEETAVGVELLGAHLAEQIRGAADVEALSGRDELDEGGPDRGEKLPLAHRQAGVLEAPPKERRSELEAGDGLVQILVRPLREAGVD